MRDRDVQRAFLEEATQRLATATEHVDTIAVVSAEHEARPYVDFHQHQGERQEIFERGLQARANYVKALEETVEAYAALDAVGGLGPEDVTS